MPIFEGSLRINVIIAEDYNRVSPVEVISPIRQLVLAKGLRSGYSFLATDHNGNSREDTSAFGTQ